MGSQHQALLEAMVRGEGGDSEGKIMDYCTDTFCALVGAAEHKSCEGRCGVQSAGKNFDLSCSEPCGGSLQPSKDCLRKPQVCMT